MRQRDKTILIKMKEYCLEIKDTHDYFKQDALAVESQSILFASA